MTKKKETPFNNPFNALKLQQKEGELKPSRQPRPAPSRAVQAPKSRDEEAELFLSAIGEVAPVRAQRERVGPPQPPTAAQLRLSDEEAESMASLAELVSSTARFDVADSSDFVEGAVQGFDEGVMRRLRAGRFSIQAQLDLHGLRREDAKPALDDFIQKSRLAGHRCVLVITGRGLRSEDNVPVLRRGLQSWLTQGSTAKRVLGFCSAKPKDGGLGAVYVLLRR
jgi:DNA-nicking Smr family endonuclease